MSLRLLPALTILAVLTLAACNRNRRTSPAEPIAIDAASSVGDGSTPLPDAAIARPDTSIRADDAAVADPDAAPRGIDAGPTACPPCTGETYCDTTTHTCVPGCDASTRCDGGAICDTARNECVCATGTRDCAGICAPCPTEPEVASTTCEGTACVAETCSAGFVVCAAGCCPEPEWRTEIVAANGGGAPSLVLDAADQPWIVTHRDSPAAIVAYRRAGSGWSSELIDDGRNVLSPEAALDSDGTVSVGYVADHTLRVARRDGGAWRTEWVASSRFRPGFASAPGGGHRAAAIRAPGPTSTPLYLYVRASSTSSFLEHEVHADSSWQEPSVAADGSRTVVAFVPRVGGLWLADVDAAGSPHHIGLDAGNIWDFVVHVDDAGTVHLLIYDEDTPAIRHSRRTGGVWSHETVDVPGGPAPGAMRWSGLSLTSDGSTLHAAYLDFTRGGVVRHAVRRGGRWTVETVTDAAEVLGETSIAVDDTGAPHIAYPSPSSSWARLGYAVLR